MLEIELLCLGVLSVSFFVVAVFYLVVFLLGFVYFVLGVFSGIFLLFCLLFSGSINYLVQKIRSLSPCYPCCF